MTRRYHLNHERSESGVSWSLTTTLGDGIDKEFLYKLSSGEGFPLINNAFEGSGNPRSISFSLFPDPRCGDFEAELTAALDKHYQTPLAEQKYALIERAALQDIIDNLLDTDGERQFTAADLAEDLMYLLPADKNEE